MLWNGTILFKHVVSQSITLIAQKIIYAFMTTDFFFFPYKLCGAIVD